jgi:hypothetical protein
VRAGEAAACDAEGVFAGRDQVGQAARRVVLGGIDHGQLAVEDQHLGVGPGAAVVGIV